MTGPKPLSPQGGLNRIFTLHRLKLGLQSLLYVVLVLSLMGEVKERYEFEQCTPFDAPAKTIARSDYDWLIGLTTFREADRQLVVLVTLNSPQEKTTGVEEQTGVVPTGLTELCDQRRFTAKLITRLTQLKAHVIALDKIYKPTTCAADPKADDELISAIRNSDVVITRGLDEELIEPRMVDDRHCCLAAVPNLELGIPDGRAGSVKLDANSKLAPLKWPVLDGDKLIDQKTFSLVTAEAAKPGLLKMARIRIALSMEGRPYSTRVRDIPTFSAFKILCGEGAGASADWRSCHTDEPEPYISGAVVIVGDHIGERDIHPNPGSRFIYGVDLQANYVAALLDQRIYMPLMNEKLATALLFVLLLILHSAFAHFPLGRAFLVALGCWIVLVCASIVILVEWGLLLTIWLQGLTLSTICVVAMHHWTTKLE